MISTECPYCHESIWVAIADSYTFQRYVCEQCGKVCWIEHTRFMGQTYTDEEFQRMFRINDETKELEPTPEYLDDFKAYHQARAQAADKLKEVFRRVDP